MEINMKILNPSRKKIREGDIFVLQMKGEERFIYGRVISLKAVIGPMDECILIYIYKVFSNNKNEIPQLFYNELLIPPVMTNRQPWTKGYFENIENRPLDNKDKLSKHCFRNDVVGGYFDEYGNKLLRKIEPCGEYGLDSFRTIDDKISKTLGIPLAPED